ncbi:hypothetical protein Q3G72_032699 [Acer saccharum]|nr:hypothetical protein Q3G72_032699 [Acer saccharum]
MRPKLPPNGTFVGLLGNFVIGPLGKIDRVVFGDLELLTISPSGSLNSSNNQTNRVRRMISTINDNRLLGVPYTLWNEYGTSAASEQEFYLYIMLLLSIAPIRTLFVHYVAVEHCAN